MKTLAGYFLVATISFLPVATPGHAQLAGPAPRPICEDPRCRDGSCLGPCSEHWSADGKCIGICPKGLVTGPEEMHLYKLRPETRAKIDELLESESK